MKQHILIANATRFTLTSEIITPQDTATFDDIKGFWVDNKTNSAWIDIPNRPKPTSKKCDIETGEDKK